MNWTHAARINNPICCQHRLPLKSSLLLSWSQYGNIILIHQLAQRKFRDIFRTGRAILSFVQWTPRRRHTWVHQNCFFSGSLNTLMNVFAIPTDSSTTSLEWLDWLILQDTISPDCLGSLYFVSYLPAHETHSDIRFHKQIGTDGYDCLQQMWMSISLLLLLGAVRKIWKANKMIRVRHPCRKDTVLGAQPRRPLLYVLIQKILLVSACRFYWENTLCNFRRLLIWNWEKWHGRYRFWC